MKTIKLRKTHEKRMNSLKLIRDCGNNSIKNPEDILNYCDDYKDLDKEVFVCFYLNVRKKIIKREIITIGIVDSGIIHPREVFKSAILFGASAIILSHNHPSGDVSPSEEDLNITKELIKAGEILGIEVLDHVIINKNKEYWSYQNE